MVARMRWRVPASVLLVPGFLVGLGAVGRGEPEEDLAVHEMSMQAPLASRSLLLDAAASDSLVIVVGERGHVLLSEDAGEHWIQAQVPTRNTLCAVAMPDAEHIWVAGYDALILHSRDQGHTWSVQHEADDDDAPLLALWFENQQHGIAIGAYGLFLETHDGGLTWEERSLDDLDRHLYAITEAANGDLYIAGETGTVLRSSDRGNSWTALDSPYTGSYFGILALAEGGLLVYGLRGHAYHSADGGETWQRLPLPVQATFLAGMQSPGGTVALVGLSGSVFLSDPNPLLFRDHSRPDRVALAKGVFTAQDRLLLVGESGILWLDGERDSGEKPQ